MKDQKDQVLDGKNNKRINNIDELNNEATAAWADVEKEILKTHVGIPSVEGVISAKDWVDNGSKL